MGLRAELGYGHRPAGAVFSAIQHVFGTAPMAAVTAPLLHRIDRPVFRMSGGRHTVTSLLSGLPVIMVTTMGRRTGRPRTVPLIAVPSADDHLAVLGTNYGQHRHPAWVLNLSADPTATVSYRGRSVDAVARLADEAETDALFEAAAALYRGYAGYRARAADRTIRAYVLEPAP
jgi:deazaflavin-dependent oxidoreductase (nitroreductase family)